MNTPSNSQNAVSENLQAIDFEWVARDVKVSADLIEKTVRLLDEGNTIPFITRFRKDQTGGLNEKQILEIKRAVQMFRALVDRKAFVIKSIESQGALTEELKARILSARDNRSLEDFYQPFKSQKQSRAMIARQQGLEPLVDEIINATVSEKDLAVRATEFVRVDKGLKSVDDVIRGVSDLLIEQFSVNRELKEKLRQIVKQTGEIVTKGTAESQPSAKSNELPATPVAEEIQPQANVSKANVGEANVSKANVSEANVPLVDSTTDENQSTLLASAPVEIAETSTIQPQSAEGIGSTDEIQSETESDSVSGVVVSEAKSSGVKEKGSNSKDRKPKKKKKKSQPDPFKDYNEFRQSLKNFSNHQVLAINRGERSGKLKVKIQADEAKLHEAAISALVPEGHAHAEFLKKCALEALSKSMLPSVEREFRREFTENAEKHATEVFANNLRNLLLQPPMPHCVVLAIDPGFKSGCGCVVLDSNGNVLANGNVYVVGNQAKRDESVRRIVDWVNRFSVDVIAIGTGAACRQAEQLVSDIIAGQLAESRVRYVMVNEAGASIYSTSEVGREELPDLAPSIRSAVSIGRRLQDPLSELVKIAPANIGVGMYQHDVKAKHLVDSLDEVVQSCVNQVGVNVNTASVSLLKFVSGLNSLTAKRLVEQRQKMDGFKNRQQLREVSGVGEATFVQSAGFLRILDGENPLDSTSIHPESYPLTEKIISLTNATVGDLLPPRLVPKVAANRLTDSTVKTSVVPEAVQAVADSVASEVPSPDAATAEIQEAVAASASSVETTISLALPAESEASGPTTEELAARDKARKEILDRLAKLEITSIANENNAGRMQVRDILLALKTPAWDPRDRVAKPIFRRGIIKIDDLKPEMQLEGQIVNVVDFGVFVDIGLGESSLVHVSQLSHQYIADPQKVFAVGNLMTVWVSEVDSSRRRVKLTAIQPGSKPASKSARGGRTHSRSSQSRSDGIAADNQGIQPASTQPKEAGQERGSRRPGRFEGASRSSRTEGAGPASGSGKKPDRRFGDNDKRQRFDSRKGQGDDRRGQHKPKVVRSNQPAAPITDEMLKGKAPMRSFSDLLQFVQKKPTQDE